MKIKGIIDVLSLCCLILQLFLAGYVLLTSSVIPVHWSISGEVDAVGAPANILWVVALALVAFFGLGWIEGRPDRADFPRTPRNPERAMRLCAEMVAWVRLTSLAFLLYLTCTIVGGGGLSAAWMSVFAGAILVVLTVYIIAIWRS